MILRIATALLLCASAFQSQAQIADPVSDLQAGRDYDLIEPPVPTTAAAGKIEVIEVFGYTCGACASMQPLVDSWKPKLGDDVEFRYLPAAFGGAWDTYARAHFAAKALGLLDTTHSAVFKVLHTERRVITSAEGVADLYAELGADRESFLATMNSFAVNAQLARARQTAQNFGTTGTPELIINGRYRVGSRQAGGFARQLEITDALIARERAALAEVKN